METAPAAPLIVPQSEFLLELLVVALDAPPELGAFDEAHEADVLRQGREPVLGGLLLAFRPLDQEPFLRARFAQPVVAMSGSHPQPREARGEAVGCTLAPGDLRPRLPPPRERRGGAIGCPLAAGDAGPRLPPKGQGQRLNRDRLVLVIPAHQLGWS